MILSRQSRGRVALAVALGMLWGTGCPLLLSGCGQFLQNLRRSTNPDDDLDEKEEFPVAISTPDPTEGGVWQERRALKGDRSQRDRAPASQSSENALLPQEISASTVKSLLPGNRRLYKNGSRATKDDFVDQSQEEGSLWASGGQTNYFFTKNKIRSPGDLVTLTIEDDLRKDIGLELKRSLSPKEKANEIALIQEQIIRKLIAAKGEGEKAAAGASANPSSPTPTPQAEAPAATPSGVPSGTPQASMEKSPWETMNDPVDLEMALDRVNMSDVNIFSAIELKKGDTMMGEVLERYPNGNYKVGAMKRLQFKRGAPRMVRVVGVAKGSDISEENDSIASSKLYEYRTEVAH